MRAVCAQRREALRELEPVHAVALHSSARKDARAVGDREAVFAPLASRDVAGAHETLLVAASLEVGQVGRTVSVVVDRRGGFHAHVVEYFLTDFAPVTNFIEAAINTARYFAPVQLRFRFV